ncbi:LysR family transcriptional regulator (plasmid) [Cupriavidus pinatubonensis]|uniref:LysR family transcriptional regulator n=1 Tax=Cupriavidus pinatubonensis TaxID=248026 RepID=UPI001C73172A|nr:LysR family transcriptional regulator [Cupriavidus pinatubonensis]QYY33535.1 LysR family transcriptional regulator [Cupriavidus pinatubonensis]
MRIDDLRAFVFVARHGSLHRATAQAGVTQSALTKALARLESEAGMRLFDRTTRGVALTQVGQSLLARAERIVLASHDFMDELEGQRSGRAGKIRLAGTPHIVSVFLMPVIAQFLARRPLARFSIDTSLTQGALQALVSGEADFACGGLVTDVPAGLLSTPLQPLAMQIVARANHPRLRSWKTLADLAEERWALPQPSSSVYQILAEALARQDLPAPRVAVEWTGSGGSVAELLRSSDLLGIVAQRTLQQADGHDLCAVGDPSLLRQPEVALFWREDCYLSPFCIEFREALIASF